MLLSAKPKENLKKMQVSGKFISVADIFLPAYQKQTRGYCLKTESNKNMWGEKIKTLDN